MTLTSDLVLEKEEVVYEDKKKGMEGLKITFLLTKKSRNIIQAYEGVHTPSSMSSCYSAKEPWVKLYKQKEYLHPATFYHYHPQTALAILYINGVPYARSLCYDRDGTGKFIQHGIVYGLFSNVLANILANKEVKKNHQPVDTHKQFVIPGRRIKIGEKDDGSKVYEYYLMYPFFDELSKVDVIFNEETKEFLMNYPDSNVFIDGKSHKGFSTAGRILSVHKEVASRRKEKKPTTVKDLQEDYGTSLYLGFNGWF